ncbi:hypothetical protein B0H14DRAFT_2339062 [Mycena olivaceomarginata]|nr:hypothetical protein B0H14DRAFT_2339062 [Mycena olivaceomarginata]
MVVENSRSTPLEVASAQFAKLATSARAIPQLTAFGSVVTLLNRILRWTNARAHVVIFRWCACVGPATIKELFELHRIQGYKAFTANPSLGSLVDHIVQYVCDVMQNAMQKEHGRRSQRSKTPRQLSTSQPDIALKHGVFGSKPADLAHVPGDLYGMISVRSFGCRAKFETVLATRAVCRPVKRVSWLAYQHNRFRT